ncbi:MAG: TPM domain-containing protein, partial [Actinomycetota bacterium]|nr:TPM domain-containing protein [Actinomycetota bacterium]
MRRLPAVLAALAAVVLLGGGPALAEPPFDVPAQLTDDADVLDGGEESRVEASLDELRATDGTQLFVVYVSSFDGVEQGEWAQATAETSGLATGDALFAIAVDDRRYGYWVPEDFPRSDAEIEQLLVSDVDPRLSEDDWDGAVVALADGLAGEGGSGSESGGGSGLGTAAVVGGIAAVAGGAYLVT